MKTLRRTAALALIALAGFGASVTPVYGFEAGFIGRMGSHGYRVDPDARNLFATMTVKPSVDRQRLYSTTILALKQAGVWNKLDMLQVYAAHDEQAARVDWKLPSRVASAVSAPTFTMDRGFNGNGTSSYVDTNYNPSTAGINYTLNSATIGVWSLTQGTSSNGIFGWSDGTNRAFINARNDYSATDARINQGSPPTFFNSDGRGLFTGVRTGAGARQVYRNASLLGSDSTSSTAIPNGSWGVDRISAAGFASVQVAASFAASGLTASEVAAVHAALSAYMTAVGAQ